MVQETGSKQHTKSVKTNRGEDFGKNAKKKKKVKQNKT